MCLKTPARSGELYRKENTKKYSGRFKDQRVHGLTARIKCGSKG